MRKIIALLLAMCVFIGLSGCTLAETDYTGLWTVRMVANETNMTATTEVPMSMELFADGKAVLTTDGQGKECTWAASENGITLTNADGSAGEFPLLNNMLVYAIPGGAFCFAKEGDLSPAAYLGLWENTCIEMGMYLIDPAENNQHFSVELKEDGIAVFNVNGQEEEGTWAVLAEGTLLLTDAGGVGKVLTFADDALTMDENDILMIFTKAPQAE